MTPARTGAWCDDHRPRSRDTRPTAGRTVYGTAWKKSGPAYFRKHPHCIDCGSPATVRDHDPVDRADLVAAGDPHPDAWHHLKPRCVPCHNRRTALRAAARRREQP